MSENGTPELQVLNSGASSELENRSRAIEQLPVEQQMAIELLLQGKTVTQTARMAGIARRTVYNWLKKNAAFTAIYNQWLDEMKEGCRARMLMLAGKAASAVEKALEAGDAKSGMLLLKEMGMLASTPDRPTEERDVRKQRKVDAMVRKLELKKKEVDVRASLAAAEMAEGMWKGKR